VLTKATITNLPAQIVKLGISHVPEGRMVFANLTVARKPDDGRLPAKDKPSSAANWNRLHMFPA